MKVFSKGVEPLAVWVLVNYMLYSLSYRTLVGVNVPSGHSKSLKTCDLSYEFTLILICVLWKFSLSFLSSISSRVVHRCLLFVHDLQCDIILAGLTVFDEVSFFFFFTALVIKLVNLAVVHGQPCTWFYVLCSVAEPNLRKHATLLLHCLPKWPYII